jgi:hypothetical protein
MEDEVRGRGLGSLALAEKRRAGGNYAEMARAGLHTQRERHTRLDDNPRRSAQCGDRVPMQRTSWQHGRERRVANASGCWSGRRATGGQQLSNAGVVRALIVKLVISYGGAAAAGPLIGRR